MAQTSQRIQLGQLEAMFSNMRAKAPWNVDGPLLWGYFFLDPSQEKLANAAKELMGSQYRLVAIDFGTWPPDLQAARGKGRGSLSGESSRKKQ
jgi:hypothetical protein